MIMNPDPSHPFSAQPSNEPPVWDVLPRQGTAEPRRIDGSRGGPWVTYSLVASTVAVYLLQIARSRDDYTIDPLGNQLAFSAEAWQDHRYFTILTYGWIHSLTWFGNPGLNVLHILGNMIALISFGPLVERTMGSFSYGALYIVGLVGGAAGWLVASGGTPDSSESIIGASGAIFAVLAAAARLIPNRWIYFSPFFLPVAIPTKLSWLVIGLCLIEVVCACGGFWQGIGHTAHLGGAVTGFCFASLWAALSRWREPRL